MGDGLTYNVQSRLFLSEVVIVLHTHWNRICCRTVAKLTSVMPMSSACYLLWIIASCATTYLVYILCAAGAYSDWLNTVTIDLADLWFSPTIPCPFANYELTYSSRNLLFVSWCLKVAKCIACFSRLQILIVIFLILPFRWTGIPSGAVWGNNCTSSQPASFWVRQLLRGSFYK